MPDGDGDARRIDASGLELAYIAKGRGPLALLLHGFPDTARTWLPTLDFLAARGWQAVALFQRGYQPSAIAADGDYSIRRLAEDALALIDRLGAGRGVIIGHDWGASAAYAAAILAPGKVAALAALAVPPFAVFENSEQERRARPHRSYLAHGEASALMLCQDDLAEVDRLYALWSPHWRVPPEHIKSVKDDLRPQGRTRAAVDYYRDPLPGEDAQAFSVKLSTPALIVWGEDEPEVRKAMLRKADSAFSTPITRHEYPGVGHWPHLEAASLFQRDIAAFLAANGAG